uniref:Secreted protein n=1 Tax=Heterorhabditis bacteriophora TaxID=37862 RepID=A0A1I7X2I6_HETBA
MPRGASMTASREEMTTPAFNLNVLLVATSMCCDYWDGYSDATRRKSLYALAGAFDEFCTSVFLCGRVGSHQQMRIAPELVTGS